MKCYSIDGRKQTGHSSQACEVFEITATNGTVLFPQGAQGSEV